MGKHRQKDKRRKAQQSQPEGRAERRRRERQTNKEKPARPAPRAPLSFRQKAFLVALGPGLLVVLELALRLVGFAAPEPLILDIKPRAAGGRWVRINEDFMRPFFSRRVEGLRIPTGRSVQNVFVLPKPPDTIRVAFLGASTTQGYPHPRNNTAAAFLEELLNDCVVQGKRAEVLNLGFVAVSSFPVACLASELHRLEPDLVVVYSGQNEFFGAYGLLSSQFGGRNVGAMKFRRTLFNVRLVRLLANVMQSIRGGRGEKTDKPLIQVMAGRGFKKPDPDSIARAAGNLETNLRSIVRRSRDAKAPVVLCTLVSNEHDVAPFGSLPPKLPEPDAEGQGSVDRAAAQDWITSRPEDAESYLEAVVERSGRSARAHYLLGRAREAAGGTTESLEQYRRAIDLDLMPWRAPSPLNDAVRAAAAEGAILADVAESFREAAGGGPIGWDLVVDHVHPSAKGHAIVAQTVVRALAGRGEIDWIDRRRLDGMPPLDEYLRRLDNGDLGRFYIAYRMASIFARPGFVESNVEAVEYHKRVALSLLESFDEPVQRAAKARFATDEFRVKEVSIHYLAAEECLRAGQTTRAVGLVDAALRTVDPYCEERLHLLNFRMTCLQRLGGEAGETVRNTALDMIACAEITRHLSKEQFMILSLLSNAYGVIGDGRNAADAIVAAWKAATLSQRESVALPLARYLALVGRRTEALEYLREAARANPRSSWLQQALSALE